MIVDEKCKNRFNTAKEKLIDYCKKENVRIYKENIIIVFSNDSEFVKNIALSISKKCAIINVTENLSEQHIINTLKYVIDICYLKTDVNLIATRIIKAYNRSNLRLNKVR